jgi:hypothetical protein
MPEDQYRYGQNHPASRTWRAKTEDERAKIRNKLSAARTRAHLARHISEGTMPAMAVKWNWKRLLYIASCKVNGCTMTAEATRPEKAVKLLTTAVKAHRA